MCLIAFALNASSRYALLLAGNRDEFHSRPALPAQWWASHPDIFAGRDLDAGGTWLGVDRRGRVAAVTNYRDRPHRGPGERSRGELSTGYLSSSMDLLAHAKQLSTQAAQFGGFNLLLFDWRNRLTPCAYLSNRHPDGALHTPEAGIHGISNHLLNTPWPKVQRLRAAMQSAVALADSSPNPHSAAPDTALEQLLLALEDQNPVGSPELVHAEGDQEVITRTPFIANSVYGTRASTVLAIEHSGMLSFIERSWTWDGDKPQRSAERRLRMNLAQ